MNSIIKITALFLSNRSNRPQSYNTGRNFSRLSLFFQRLVLAIIILFGSGLVASAQAATIVRSLGNFFAGNVGNHFSGTVGTFNYTIPTGHEIVSARIYGTFGNTQRFPHTALVDLSLDGVPIASCTSIFPGGCGNSNTQTPTPWSFDLANFLSTLNDGSATLTAVQNSDISVVLGSTTLEIVTAGPPTVTVVASDATAAEPGTDTGQFRFTLSEAQDQDLTIFFGVGGTAFPSVVLGSGTIGDYNNLRNSVVVPAGQTQVTRTVTVRDDTAPEDTETVILTLATGTGYIIGSPNQATVNILDDDPPLAPGTIKLSSATYTVGEGDGSISIPVQRMSGTDGAVSVQFSVSNGTATGGQDFTVRNSTLSWADGDGANKSFNIPILEDQRVEGNETINVTLSQVTGGATLGTPDNAVVTITDNDVAQPGTIKLSAANYSIGEGGGNVQITVQRTNGTSGPVSVRYATSNGTATAGEDYTARSGTLSWANTEGASKSFRIPITDDALDENNETINVSLSQVTGGATLGSPNSAVVTINDNDTAQPGVIRLSAATYTVAEGGGNIQITVQRNNGTDGAVSVQYATSNGSATAGSDYTARSGTLSWANSEGASKSFSIPILEDQADENNETINVSLSQVTGGATLGTPDNAVVTIADNDDAGELAFSAANYNVDENAGTVTLTVARTGGSSGAASVQVATRNGTATAGADYTATTQTLSWAAGQQGNRTLTVGILDDTLTEGTETINVSLSNASGAPLGTPATAQVRIADVEDSGQLQFSTTSYSGDENGGPVTIEVMRVGGSSGAVSVQYATSNGSATAGSDYTARSGTLNWADGDSGNKRFTVPVLTDADDTEGDETVQLALSNAMGAALGVPSAATLTIRAQVVEPGGVSTLQFTQAAFQVNESSGTAALSVARSGSATGAVMVAYRVVGVSAQAGSDFTAQDGQLSWADGDMTPKLVTINLQNDAELEGVEQLEVLLMTPTGAELGTLFRATLNIADDEVAAGPLSNLSGTSGETIVQQFRVSNVKAGISIAAATGTVVPTFIDGTSGLVTYRLTIPLGTPLGTVLSDTVTITDADSVATTVTAKIVVQQKLSDLDVLTPTQKSVADAVDELCTNSTDAGLQARCTALNNLNEADQRLALNAIAPDEVAAQGTQAIEVTTIQLSNLRSRLAAVRNGARGFAFNGFGIGIQEDEVPLGALVDASRRGRGGQPRAQGGAAGDDLLGAASRWSGFINGRLNFGEKDSTALETGFDFDKMAITLGADYRFNDQLFMGAALGLSSLDAEFAGSGGDLSSDSTSLAVYGSYYNEKEYFADWIVSLGQNQYDMTRRITFAQFDDAVKGDTDGSQFSLSVNAGMDKRKGEYVVSPYVRVDYINVEIDGYQESGNSGLELALGDQSVDSLTIALGGRVARSYSRSWGIMTPSADLSLEREFKDDARQITSSFINDPNNNFTTETDDPDRVYFNLGLGVAAQFSAGRAGFIRYDTVLGLDDVADHTLEAGIRMEF